MAKVYKTKPPRVVSAGKKPTESGVKTSKAPKETAFQKLIKGWPPKEGKDF